MTPRGKLALVLLLPAAALFACGTLTTSGPGSADSGDDASTESGPNAHGDANADTGADAADGDSPACIPSSACAADACAGRCAANGELLVVERVTGGGGKITIRNQTDCHAYVCTVSQYTEGGTYPCSDPPLDASIKICSSGTGGDCADASTKATLGVEYPNECNLGNGAICDYECFLVP
jgi:hypothetical protein